MATYRIHVTCEGAQWLADVPELDGASTFATLVVTPQDQPSPGSWWLLSLTGPKRPETRWPGKMKWVGLMASR